MFSLGYRLLPYAMVLGGLAVAGVMLMTIIKGPETEPTAVDIAAVSGKSPGADWLKVTGGGLHLNETLTATKSNRSGTKVTETGYYVPLIPMKDAGPRIAAALKEETLPYPDGLVLVYFKPDEFKAIEASVTEENLGFIEREVQGLRKEVLLPSELKEHIRDEMKMSMDAVVVLGYEDEPIQRAAAIAITGAMFVVVLLGAIWVTARFRTPGDVYQHEARETATASA